MIVTVRRWTSIALPRLWARDRTGEPAALGKERESRKSPGFLEAYQQMFEHQVSLVFKEDLAQ